MKKSTLILLAIGLVFGSYLYFVEAERELPSEEGESQQRYLVDFPVEEATWARIAIGEGSPAYVEKIEDGWETWAEDRDRRYEADPDWVDDFLELVRGVQGVGLVEEGAVELANYGITDHSAGIEIRGQSKGGEEWVRRIIVGDENPTGEKLYVTTHDQDKVFLMDGYMRGQLDRGVGDFRPRRLLEFDLDKVKQVEIAHHSAEAFQVERAEGTWRGPEDAMLAPDKVDAMLGDLKYLVVDQFTFEKVAETAAEFGLDSPTHTITLKNAAGSELARLRVGNRVEKGSGSFYVATNRSDEVFTVKPSAIAELPRTVEDLAPATDLETEPDQPGGSPGISPELPPDVQGLMQPGMNDADHAQQQ